MTSWESCISGAQQRQPDARARVCCKIEGLECSYAAPCLRISEQPCIEDDSLAIVVLLKGKLVVHPLGLICSFFAKIPLFTPLPPLLQCTRIGLETATACDKERRTFVVIWW
eukprot:860810-Amphidinium_carterae.1